MRQTEYALIVAGGRGIRFGSAIPKQFLELNGRPVLLHTLDAFYRYADSIQVVLVLPEAHFPAWNELSKKHAFQKPLILEKGGATRFQSVKNGLKHVSDGGFVAIHDGVRPLVSVEIIEASFRLVKAHGVAVAAVGLKESLRMLDPGQPGQKDGPSLGGTKAVDRSLYKMIQTPQTFSAGLIKDAYSRPENPALTDDASVAESAGYPVFLFEGSYENIKITTAEDLVMAEALLKAGKSRQEFPNT